MADSPFVHLGPALPYGDPRCGFSPTLRHEDTCLAPATWHVKWDLDGNTSLNCDEHMAYAKRAKVFRACHRLSPDCTEPGAQWLPDRCLVPGDGARSLVGVREGGGDHV